MPESIVRQVLKNSARESKRALSGESLGLNTLKDAVMNVARKGDDLIGGGLLYKGGRQKKVIQDLTGSQADAIQKSLGKKAGDMMLSTQGVTDAAKRSAIENHASIISDAAGKVKAGANEMMTDKGMFEMAKEFYTGADGGGAKSAAKRLGATGAGLVGLRYATGGNLTSNGKGEKDIAGIPFI